MAIVAGLGTPGVLPAIAGVVFHELPGLAKVPTVAVGADVMLVQVNRSTPGCWIETNTVRSSGVKNGPVTSQPSTAVTSALPWPRSAPSTGKPTSESLNPIGGAVLEASAEG
jgi:hypothetical protein